MTDQIIHTRSKEWDAKGLSVTDRIAFGNLVDEQGLFGRPNREWLSRRDMDRVQASNGRLKIRLIKDENELVESALSARKLAWAFLDDGPLTGSTVFRDGLPMDEEGEEIPTSLEQALHGGVTVEAVNDELARVLATMPRAISALDTWTYVLGEDGNLVQRHEHVMVLSKGETRRYAKDERTWHACPRTTGAWKELMGDALDAVWRSVPLRQGDDEDEKGDPLSFDGEDILLRLANGKWMSVGSSEWGSAGL